MTVTECIVRIIIMELKELFPNIYACGNPSEKTWGAHAYFVRTESGNVLIDTPDFTPGVADALEKAGGVDWIFITHMDDIGDCCHFQNRFSSKIVMHAAECTAVACTVDIAFNKPTELSPELLVIPTPGHSPGSSSLLFSQTPGFLFTGDHLMGTRKDAVLPAKFSWTHDWDKQLQSAWALLDYPFDVVLPAHHNIEKGYVTGAKQALRHWLDSKIHPISKK